jgi:hypothetical protein
MMYARARTQPEAAGGEMAAGVGDKLVLFGGEDNIAVSVCCLCVVCVPCAVVNMY